MPLPRSAAGLLLAVSSSFALLAQEPEPPRYGRDVRPILADRCFRCHGPDAGTRAAELRLDERDAALAPRGNAAPAIVPGAPDSSELMRRITADDAHRMPPVDSGKPPLRDDERATLAAWIRAGANYEPHWAFVAPQPIPLPPQPDETAPAHPVDRFLGAARDRAGLTAAPPAEPAVLARRLFLVLTGLPPTPEEIDRFVADTRPDAYERLVDQLLDSEPYRSRHAEHLAQMWLDAGRYADTSGIHMDAGRQAWQWRDWLLQALRDDMPFDRFVVEQLAGDLLPGATVQQQVATGFLRNHVTTDEGGAIDAEYLVEYAAERTATVGSVFLGLTMGCARCHDHKYDPIRQEDYFRLFSFFNSNREPGLYSQDQDANRALEPFIQVPSEEQATQRERLGAELAEARRLLDEGTADEAAAFDDFAASTLRNGPSWRPARVLRATSSQGSTLLDDGQGAVLASGHNPPTDEHCLELAIDGDGDALRWLCVEATPHDSLPLGKVGRAPNGNAVLQYLHLEARPLADASAWQPVPLIYALADVEQSDGDHVAGNVLTDDRRGWAVAAHQSGPRPARLAVLAAAPFGHRGGTVLRVTLRYDSVYPQHAFGRVRVLAAASDPQSQRRLPVAASGFFVAGPFAGPDNAALYSQPFGPESATRLDLEQRWGKRRWRHDGRLALDRVNGELPAGASATYVAQELWSASDRDLTVTLGSDDGFVLFVNGKQIAERRIDRGIALDQDQAVVPLRSGANLLVLKVVNTGGPAGFALRHRAAADELAGELRLLALPAPLADADAVGRLSAAFRRSHSPQYAARQATVSDLEQRIAALERAIPRAMVMHEAEMPRPTFVLQRGEYDKPDHERPVARELPAMFGRLPEGAQRNRLGLAQWLVSPDNPLFLRVAVNRLWEFVFGAGIVRTSEDFGLQGEWPSHPELLDWLAGEFRARGHSTRAMLRLLVTSAAFRQHSRRDPHAAQKDPEARLLAWFPRRRLAAETLRDQALFVSGLLVESIGGPSVKPLQPDGLWQEVAMPQSNTRSYQPGSGPELWRRSLYTYWKRACPPPTLLTFDAPTREFCTIRRTTTNTPLQALALWNDDQFVAAAAALARRTLHDGNGAEAERLQQMHRRCTGRALDDGGLAAARATLSTLRERFVAAPDDAIALLQARSTSRSGEAIDPNEATALAPWVVLATAFLTLDATLCLP